MHKPAYMIMKFSLANTSLSYIIPHHHVIDVSSLSEQCGDRFSHLKTDTRDPIQQTTMQYSLSSMLHNQSLCHNLSDI